MEQRDRPNEKVFGKWYKLSHVNDNNNPHYATFLFQNNMRVGSDYETLHDAEWSPDDHDQHLLRIKSTNGVENIWFINDDGNTGHRVDN